MNILKLKRIFYLFITLAVVGVLVTSCEREIIIEDDIDGFKKIIIEDDIEGVKEIIIEEDIDGVKTTGIGFKDKNDSNFNNYKKGAKIFIKPNLFKEYINILMAKKKLMKKEIADAIHNVTIEELSKFFTDSQLANGIINISEMRFGIALTECGFNVNNSGDPDNPDDDLNMACYCMEHNFGLLEAATLDYLSNPSYQNCITMATAQCNVAITEANCDGSGPIEDCNVYFEFCYSLDDDECDCPVGKKCINGNCVAVLSTD